MILLKLAGTWAMMIVSTLIIGVATVEKDWNYKIETILICELTITILGFLIWLWMV